MALTLQQKLQINDYLVKCTGSAFQWGINDCNTFAIQIFDIINNTNKLDKVKEKYYNKRSAIKFQKEYLSPRQIMHVNKFTELTDIDFEWQDGDVALVEHKYYATAYVYFNRVFWSVPEEQELTAYDPDTVKCAMTSGWRHNG